MKTKRLWLTSIAAIFIIAVSMVSCKDENVEVNGVCPIVESTNPANLASFVPLDQIITATFNEEMNAATFTQASFSLQALSVTKKVQNTEAVEKVSSTLSKQEKSSSSVSTTIVGTVTYSGLKATFTPSDPLETNTNYTATIERTVKDLKGNYLQTDYVWTFSTGVLAPPTVISTDPVNLATNVDLDKTISANFSMVMDPLTITAATFTLSEGATPIAGVVDYSGTTATFNPSSALQADVTYTATISSGVANNAGTEMGSNYAWTFSTGATISPTVISTDPADLATNVVIEKVISAKFNMAMDPLTITNSTFTLMEGVNSVNGTLNYSGTTATFIPNSDLLLDVTYTATITTGAQNVEGNALENDYIWNFTTQSENPPEGPEIVDLGTAGDFAILTKSGISTIGTTLITGHIGISPATSTAFTGFSETMDASGEFATSDYVVGRMYAADYANPTPSYVSTAISDQETAFTEAMGLTTDVIVDLGAGNISGMTLAPGLYKWGTGLLITNQGVTLEGGSNDTWVFQIADDFTIENDAKITLAGGALPENIFWITSTQALLGSNVEFYGNVLAQTLISLTNGTTVYGRLLSQTAVTLDASIVTKP